MKEVASLHDFKIGLLKILYLRYPSFLNKGVMKRMPAVYLEVFVAVEMHRYTESMGILWADLLTDLKVFYPGYSGQFAGGR